MKANRKRVFWAFPFKLDNFSYSVLPKKGRKIQESSMHATLLFLGDIDFTNLDKYLQKQDTSLPFLSVAGLLNKGLFLPSRKKARIFALTGNLSNFKHAEYLVQRLQNNMKELGYSFDKRSWLFHVSLVRAPFNIEEWGNINFFELFHPKTMILYESKPGLTYSPIFKQRLQPLWDFRVNEDARLNIRVRAKSLNELYINICLSLFDYTKEKKFCESIYPQFQIQDKYQFIESLIKYYETLNLQIYFAEWLEENEDYLSIDFQIACF